MNKTASMIGACILAACGVTGLGVYFSYTSQTINTQLNNLSQSNKEGSNLNHSVQNVTYNINHNHYYTTEQKAK